MNLQQTFATVLGAVLLLIGLLGVFMSGTLIVFGISPIHNGVHVISGLVGLLAGLAASGAYAHLFNKVFGIVYGLVAVLGFVGVGIVMTTMNINLADNILHTVIALACIGVGFGAKE